MRVRNITIGELTCAFGWHFRPLNTRSVFAYSTSRMDIGLARSRVEACEPSGPVSILSPTSANGTKRPTRRAAATSACDRCCR